MTDESTVPTTDPIPPNNTPTESWLPEDLRSNERLSVFKDPVELAKAFAAIEPVQPAPETYEAPAGIPEQLVSFAKENNWSQAQFNKALELQTTVSAQQLEALDNSYKEGAKELFKSWGTEAKANVQLAQKALKYMDETGELGKMLTETRAGNHPSVIKALHKIGTMLKEGKFLDDSQAPITEKPKSMAARMFPNHPSKENQ